MASSRIESVESLVVERSHFVRIRCDDGLTGLGQSAAWGYPDAVHAVISEFREYLIGKNPAHIEHHWQYLFRMGPFRGSILGGALSAVDIALWDIKGQRLGTPIWDLLGGACRDRVRLLLILEPPAGSVEELCRQAKDAVAEGFSAVKFDPFPDGYQDMGLDRLCETASERMRAVREVVGADVDVVLELHRKLTPVQFLSVSDVLRPLHPLFLEDPIQIDSTASQGLAARRSGGPVGNGERLNTIWEFRELLEAGGPQFVRPDLGLAGGFSQSRKIAAIAEAHHATLCTHCYFGPVLTAACVHLDVATPNFLVQEYSKRTNEGPFGSAFQGRVRREGGYLLRPEEPGLGVTLDESRAVQIWPEGWRLSEVPLLRADGSAARAV